MKQLLGDLSNISGRYRKQIVAGLITLVTASGVLGLRQLGAWQQVELKGLDYLFQLRPAEPIEDRIVIVEISEDDIQRQSKWPWSDQIFSDLINKISDAKAAVITIDKFLDIPSGEGRENLVRAIKKAGNVVNSTFLSQGKQRSIEIWRNYSFPINA